MNLSLKKVYKFKVSWLGLDSIIKKNSHEHIFIIK